MIQITTPDLSSLVEPAGSRDEQVSDRHTSLACERLGRYEAAPDSLVRGRHLRPSHYSKITRDRRSAVRRTGRTRPRGPSRSPRPSALDLPALEHEHDVAILEQSDLRRAGRIAGEVRAGLRRRLDVLAGEHGREVIRLDRMTQRRRDGRSSVSRRTATHRVDDDQRRTGRVLELASTSLAVRISSTPSRVSSWRIGVTKRSSYIICLPL